MVERACSTTVSRPLGEVTPLHIETSTRCHHCTLNMGDERYSVPISYDAVTNTYRSYGCFCSLNCCKAYIQERNDPLLTSFLSSTLSALYGLRMEDLNASPPRNALALYGGSLSESEYNECKTTKRVCLHTEPLVPTFSVLTTTKHHLSNLKRPAEPVVLGRSGLPLASLYEEFFYGTKENQNDS